MLVAVVMAGCGSVGKSSIDPSGTWAYTITQKQGKPVSDPKVRILTIEKLSDHTYQATIKTYEYSKHSELHNEDAYYGGRMHWHFMSAPEEPNRETGVKPEIVYTYLGEIDPFTAKSALVTYTERDGVLYKDSDGASATMEDGKLVFDKETWTQVEDFDGAKKLLQDTIKEDLNKNPKVKVVDVKFEEIKK